MEISVIGIGRVGSALLFPLASNPRVSRILLVSRSPFRAQAAIMDVASADSYAAAKLHISTVRDTGTSEIIVLSCGVARSGNREPDSERQSNEELIQSLLPDLKLHPKVKIVTVTSPVDLITPLVHRSTGIPPERVFGFGGDLDYRRLEWILMRKGSPRCAVAVVGEHGPRAIPVYNSSLGYSEIANEVRHFVSVIAQAGPLRNVAPGLVLAQLLDCIIQNSGEVRHVCGFHPAYQTYLTWPFSIGRDGTSRALPIVTAGPALTDLTELLRARNIPHSQVFSVQDQNLRGWAVSTLPKNDPAT